MDHKSQTSNHYNSSNVTVLPYINGEPLETGEYSVPDRLSGLWKFEAEAVIKLSISLRFHLKFPPGRFLTVLGKQCQLFSYPIYVVPEHDRALAGIQQKENLHIEPVVSMNLGISSGVFYHSHARLKKNISYCRKYW